MNDAAQETQEFAFQAEIKRLLDLLANSLYQSKEIAVRELVSNASDALDKARHLALTDPNVGDVGELDVSLEPDAGAGTLTVADNGVGMTRDELVANLGTIAKSGSLEFLSKLSGDARKDLSLIGQFGVGFYAAFMLADRVTVRSRSVHAAPDEPGWEWESDGAGRFTVRPLPDLAARGTRVVLHLKPDTKAEYSDPVRLKAIVRRYSGFLNHPLRIAGERVNDVRPIWVEPKSQVTPEQYEGFYRHLTHGGGDKPLFHLHLSSDSPIQFHAILYCPPKNFELLGFGKLEQGLNLCAKRVLVQAECRELLPEWLRFLVGIVDSQDLPLNISRETLQDNTVLRRIRGTLVRKTLDRLKELSDEGGEAFGTFYRQFGPILKEGVHEERDAENRERIAKLLRFHSTREQAAEPAVTLDAYVGRMPEGQKAIYFLGGPDLASLRRNANLDVFRQRGVEVLLLPDPVDEVVLSVLREFGGKQLLSADAADPDLPAAPAGVEAEKKDEEAPADGLGKVIVLFKSALGDKVQEVRASKRLTEGLCCLVSPDGAASAQMQKILQMYNKDVPPPRRVLEINPRAALVRRLALLANGSQHDAFVASCGEQMYADALLLEGTAADPLAMVARVEQFMLSAAEKLSPIVF